MSPKKLVDLTAEHGNSVFSLRHEIQRIEAQRLAFYAQGGDWERTNQRTSHPVYQAAKKMLVDYLVDENTGNTAAHMIALSEHSSEHRYRMAMLEGEPLFIQNYQGKTPLDILNERQRHGLARMLPDLVAEQEVVLNDAMLVIRYGADAKFNHEESPGFNDRYPPTLA